MAAGLPATDAQVQALAQQWMGLVHHWLGGDFTLIELRGWGRSGPQSPAIQSPMQKRRPRCWLASWRARVDLPAPCGPKTRWITVDAWVWDG